MNRVIILLAVLAVASCSYGMTDKKFRPARDPHGIQTSVITESVELRGELIELQDSGMVILSSWFKSSSPGGHLEKHERVLRLVPYASIRLAQFDQLDLMFAIRDGLAPAGQVRERLRSVSRFPYGMSPQVLAALLQAHGQAALAGLE